MGAAMDSSERVDCPARWGFGRLSFRDGMCTCRDCSLGQLRVVGGYSVDWLWSIERKETPPGHVSVGTIAGDVEGESVDPIFDAHPRTMAGLVCDHPTSPFFFPSRRSAGHMRARCSSRVSYEAVGGNRRGCNKMILLGLVLLYVTRNAGL